jgi:diaminopimelate epimerase
MDKLRKGTTEVVMLGGSVKIDMDPDGNAAMTGPARKVFAGRLSVDI